MIPTHNRPHLVEGAVESALAQSLADLEVVVVDDGSEPPLELPAHERVRVIRRDSAGGVASARNAGLAAARGRYVTFLDDDNRVLPHMAEVSLAAIRRSTLPPPVAVMSGHEIVRHGRVVERRVPPSHPRGEHFSLRPPPPGRSHMTKSSLVVETEVLRSVGGFDPALRAREQSDLLWRLNPVCSIEGIEVFTRRVDREPRQRLSRNAGHLEAGLHDLVEKHRELLAQHPRGHADVWLGHARMSIVAGPRRAIVPSIMRAFRIAPRHTAGVLLSPGRVWYALRTLRTSG